MGGQQKEKGARGALCTQIRKTIFTCRGHRLRGQLGDARFHPVGRLLEFFMYKHSFYPSKFMFVNRIDKNRK